jgi:hypothetical protein
VRIKEWIRREWQRLMVGGDPDRPPEKGESKETTRSFFEQPETEQEEPAEKPPPYDQEADPPPGPTG